MNSNFEFRWNPVEEAVLLEGDDGENATPSSSSRKDLAFWSDFVEPPPQVLRVEDPQFQQFLMHQQQYDDILTPNVVQPTVTLPSLEHAQVNFEPCLPSQKDQVVAREISVGKSRDPDHSGEPKKRLKSAQSSAHNVSEKRRRDRFKERIKTLQELLPDCDRTDTASVLEETAKRIRLLKCQAQQYMPSPWSPMTPTQTNVLGMVPYPTMLHYPGATAMMPQMQMMPFLRPPPILPYSTASSSMATVPRVALFPNPRVPSIDQVMANVSGQVETTNGCGGDGAGSSRVAPPLHLSRGGWQEYTR